jgi:hypothetical protein
MKFNFTYKIVSVGLIITFAFLNFACQKPQPVETPGTQTPQPVETSGAQTPTEAYKMLFAAVKSKDTEKIKQMVSKETHGLAEFMAARQNQPIAKSFENGFTATTFSAELPEIRDERVKDEFGAVEVYNQQDKRWEDLPFIKEGLGWKLAIGDVFKGTHKSPGDPKSQATKNASNASAGNMIPTSPNTNGNSLTNTNIKSDKNKSIEAPFESPANKKPNE